jgi:nucleotide-binding universal stress UspA family protein
MPGTRLWKCLVAGTGDSLCALWHEAFAFARRVFDERGKSFEALQVHDVQNAKRGLSRHERFTTASRMVSLEGELSIATRTFREGLSCFLARIPISCAVMKVASIPARGCERGHTEPWPRSLQGKAAIVDSDATMNDYSGVTFRNILHLTDFSDCSDAALRWAMSMANANEAKLSVLHVVVPDALVYLTPSSPTVSTEIQEEWANREMQRIEKRLPDLRHATMVTRGKDVWSAVERTLKQVESDLIVLGTHGRTGLRKILMGSVAERVLRSSAVPVMTVGPAVARVLGDDGKFHRVVLATDLAAGSAEAAGYAIAFAQRDEAKLVVVHACKQSRQSKQDRSARRSELSVAEVLHRLGETIPCADSLRHRPETLLEYGEPGARIVEVAKRKEADLIVMGIREAKHLFAATHLDVGTVHNVVAQAPCPVLTVRDKVRQAA